MKFFEQILPIPLWIVLLQAPSTSESPAGSLPSVLPSSESLNSATGYGSFFYLLAITLGTCLGFYLILYPFLKAWFRKFNSDLLLVALGTSRFPLTIVIAALGLNLAFQTLPQSIIENVLLQLLEKFLASLAVLSVTYWIVQLFMRVVIYALKDYAEQTEAMWDDVLVPILEGTLPVVLYLTGGLLALQVAGLDLTGLWVAIGGAAFVLGFALKDILANFFSGLVLLIDTPFRFGDVVTLPDKSRAIIRKIGLRTTQLYLIDTHCEVFIPNGSFQGQNIINLSRPTSHYYYTLSVKLPNDVDPSRASRLIEEVVLAHPDTLGNIDYKLRVLDKYFGFSGTREMAAEKRESGRQRLLLEKQVNDKLQEVETAATLLTKRIKRLEQGGLDADEIKEIREYFLHLCALVGLSIQSEHRSHKRKRPTLEETTGVAAEGQLIDLIRCWYRAWLDDPDLIQEDKMLLPKNWEQKIGLLSIKLARLYQLICNPEGQETRLDDYLEDIKFWLRDSFKSSRNEWQDPKVWIVDDYSVKFFIDDITLEHCERGNRIQSEVYREMIWHLRQAYLLR